MTQSTPEQQERLDKALNVLPPRFQQMARRLLRTWLGRIGLGTSWNLQRIGIFDRAMAVAAQLFTSVFPMLILLASWFGNTGTLLNDTLGMPPEAESQVDAALKEGGSTSFGIIGALIVVISATSLSRALARTFASVWALPKPKSNLASAWRWLAVLITITLSLVVLRRSQTLADDIPPPHVWAPVVHFFLLAGLAMFVPWVLLKGVVSARALLPGALLFAVALTLIRPPMNIWLSHSLETSAVRYGSIGVAFTYLAWMYVVAWAFIAAAVIGQVVVTDRGLIGRSLAGPEPLVRTDRIEDASVSRVLVDDEP